MLQSIGLLFGILLVAGLLVSTLLFPFEKPLPYFLGLLMGSLLSAAKVILLEKSLGNSLDMEGTNARNYAGAQAVLRYFLTILVLLPVFFLPGIFGLFGTILGILALQFAAYITGFRLKGKQEL